MCINKKIIKFISLLFPFLLGGMVIFFAEREDGTNNVAEAELFTEEKSMMQQNKVEVVNVYDGDSLDVLGSNGKKIKLRLYGIDAPEKGQNFSQSAKVFLEDTVKDKLYSLDVRYKDKYGRYVAVLFDENGIALQEDLIRNGFAWVYPQFCEDIILCVGWQHVQEEAVNSRQGLWQEKILFLRGIISMAGNNLIQGIA